LQPDPALQIPPHPFPEKGWTCRINGDELPEWIPPWWIDATNDLKSTYASDASTPNANQIVGDDDDHPTPRENSERQIG
jgi:hypothetical protein